MLSNYTLLLHIVALYVAIHELRGPASKHLRSVLPKRIPQDPSCGTSFDLNPTLDISTLPPLKSFKRAASGCPASVKRLTIGIVADCSFLNRFTSAAEAATKIFADFEKAKASILKATNVQLSMGELLMFEKCGGVDGSGIEVPFNRLCSASYTIGNRLSDFALWRGIKKADGMGLWHLMSRCNTG